MGTPKRERQKTNRQIRLQELAHDARVAKTKRVGLRYGIGIPVVIAVLWGLVLLVNGGDDKVATPTTTTVTATTVAPFPAPVTVPGATITGDTPCPEADGSSARTITFAQEPPMCIDTAKQYEAVITTNKGSLTVALDAVKAPINVNNFVVLARYHYFDNTQCHRIIPQFVGQCGDPTATGNGGPGYSVIDELPQQGEYQIGSLAMANSGSNTSGSQFFIISGANGAALPPNYSLFGMTTAGLDTVTAIDAAGNGDPSANGSPTLQQVIIESVVINEL